MAPKKRIKWDELLIDAEGRSAGFTEDPKLADAICKTRPGWTHRTAEPGVRAVAPAAPARKPEPEGLDPYTTVVATSF